MTTQAKTTGTNGSIWTRAFTTYWAASVQSVFGNALSSVVVAVLVYELTGKPSAMGLTLALGMLPALLSPFAGVVVDRVPIKSLLVAANVVRGLLVLGLALLVGGAEVSIWALNVVVLAGGLLTAFTTPASAAFLPELVEEEHLAQGNALMGMGQQSAQLVGLLAGAGLVAWLGETWTLLLDATTFGVMALALASLRLSARVQLPQGEAFWASFKNGIGALRQAPDLLPIPLLAFVINVAFAPVQMLLPAHLGLLGLAQENYGVALGAVMGGMLLGSAAISALGSRFKPKLALPLGLLGAGAALLGLALTAHVATFFAACIVLGVGVATTNTAIAYLGQTQVAADYRGRVFGLISATSMAGMPLALIALGPVADSLGSRPLWAGAGGLVLASTLLWWVWTGRRQKAKAEA